jgi:valine--pyruvate aminotransferase
MNLSKFGRGFTSASGILQLMDDLGHVAAGDRTVLMLGAGNPGHIPQMLVRFRESMYRALERTGRFEHMIGAYDPPAGPKDFIDALSTLLNREYGWDVNAENIALTNGSQTAFFFLFNMLAGAFEDGTYKKILLPLAPEYIGYADLGLSEDFFVTRRPRIAYVDEHTFKYHIDFSAISISDEVGAICVSRPTNPTGNVLTNEEVEHLCELSRSNSIPLIIDNAYGPPFPNIVFTEATPVWDDHIILCMSLSKLGLPAFRTGIVIAHEDVIAAVSRMNAIIGLAPGGVGAALVVDLIRTGEIIGLSRDVIKPYYQSKAEQAVAWLRKELDGLDFYIHKPEGAFFLWLWLKGLPITAQALYEWLKQRGVLVLPGHHFFPGLEEEWRHKHECIRVTYSQDSQIVREGLRIIGEEVRRAYDDGP